MRRGSSVRSGLCWACNHRDTKTQRKTEPKILDAVFLCVFVSLWLLPQFIPDESGADYSRSFGFQNCRSEGNGMKAGIAGSRQFSISPAALGTDEIHHR